MFFRFFKGPAPEEAGRFPGKCAGNGLVGPGVVLAADKFAHAGADGASHVHSRYSVASWYSLKGRNMIPEGMEN